MTRSLPPEGVCEHCGDPTVAGRRWCARFECRRAVTESQLAGEIEEAAGILDRIWEYLTSAPPDVAGAVDRHGELARDGAGNQIAEWMSLRGLENDLEGAIVDAVVHVFEERRIRMAALEAESSVTGEAAWTYIDPEVAAAEDEAVHDWQVSEAMRKLGGEDPDVD